MRIRGPSHLCRNGFYIPGSTLFCFIKNMPFRKASLDGTFFIAVISKTDNEANPYSLFLKPVFVSSLST
jgi:hypothetical protein